MGRVGKTVRRLAVCLTALLLLPLGGPARAVASLSQQTVTPKIAEWDNGAKVGVSSSGTAESFQASVQADTTGLKQGYYSVYVFDNTSRSVEPYDAIAFDLQNLGASPLKLSLTMKTRAGETATIGDSSYAILEAADQSLREAVQPLYGTVSVPAGFSGTVYVPFSRLYTSEGKTLSFSRIQSWGVTAVLSENQQAQFRFGNIRFLGGSVSAMKSRYFLVSITGSGNAVIPRKGSLLTLYEASARDMDGGAVKQTPVFSLKEKVPGASISPDGKLQIDSSCTAAGVTVCAKVPGSLSFAQTAVSLQKAGLGQSDKSAGVPAPAGVARLTGPVFRWLDGAATPLRAAGVVIILLLAAVWYAWFHEDGANYRRIRKKLTTASREGEKKP